MYNLIEHSDNYAKTLECSWQYHIDDPNNTITYPEPFKFKARIKGRASTAGNTKDIKIAVPLKYLSYFWRTLEMPVINWEISLLLNWLAKFIFTNSADGGTFQITDTKL